jgi:thioredoxin reductase
VTESNATEEGFQLKVDEGGRFSAKRILFATGIVDRMPLYSELKDCLGISVFVCPDCDGYEVIGQRTLVLGSGNAGANMALTLTYFTKELVYINHERRKLDEEIVEKLKEQSIQFYNQPVSQVLTDQAKIQGVILENGEQIHASRAFSAFGGNEIRSDLAKSLGVKLHENRHIRNDPRTKMTNVKNVWAAGDVATHSEQAVIAMGEGLQAAIWIHKSLIKR